MANGFAAAESANTIVAGTGACVTGFGLVKLFKGFTPTQKQLLPYHNDPTLDTIEELANAGYDYTIGAGLLTIGLAIGIKFFIDLSESRLNGR
jgi:hypothetical protein